MDSKMDTDDKRYILCEFVNEDTVDQEGKNRPVREGYAEWIIFNDAEPRRSVSDLIDTKSVVVMKWAGNYDVMPWEAMKKLPNIEWKKNVVATILAQSDEWTVICEARRNVIQHGVPFPTRRQRKELTKVKRNQDDSSQKASTSTRQDSRKKQSDHDETLVSQAKRMRHNKSYDRVYNDSDDNDELPLMKLTEINKKKLSASSKDNPNRCKTAALKAAKKSNTIKKVSISDSEESCCSDDQQHRKEPKSALLDTISILKEENAVLRRELALYKTMEHILIDFPKLSKEVETIIDRCRQENQKNEEIRLSTVKETTVSTACLFKTVPSTLPRSTGDFNEPKVDTTVLSKIGESDNVVTVDSKPEYSGGPEINLSSSQDTNEDYVMFGCTKISQSMLSKLRHQKATILASDLMPLVFTPQEMALKSMKGKANNRAKHSFIKEPIDEERVNAIVDYICKKKGLDRKIEEASIRAAIVNKLGNFCRTPEAKEILAAQLKLSDHANNNVKSANVTA